MRAPDTIYIYIYIGARSTIKTRHNNDQVRDFTEAQQPISESECQKVSDGDRVSSSSDTLLHSRYNPLSGSVLADACRRALSKKTKKKREESRGCHKCKEA